MIESISIRNFETHVKTDIEFCKGVNVIVGESDEGKSGLVRAVKWNSLNRPVGDSYRNDELDPKKKEDKLKVTEVGIVYKGTGLVNRARDGFSGGVNHYQIDTEEPLRALRTDVPDEVREVTKMKEVNIQGQHPSEQYFLIGLKPGQVAKEFNKVAGLTVMDKAAADINKQVRTCNAEISVTKAEIESKETEIKDTEWVEDAEKFAKKLSNFKDKVEQTTLEEYAISEKIIHLENIEIQLTEFHDIEDALEYIESLKSTKQEIVENEYSLNQINDLIAAIIDVDSQLNASIDIDIALKRLKTLKIEKEAITNSKNKLERICNLVWQVEETEKQFKIAEKELEGAKILYANIRQDQECPTCGRMGE